MDSCTNMRKKGQRASDETAHDPSTAEEREPGAEMHRIVERLLISVARSCNEQSQHMLGWGIYGGTQRVRLVALSACVSTWRRARGRPSLISAPTCATRHKYRMGNEHGRHVRRAVSQKNPWRGGPVVVVAV